MVGNRSLESILSFGFINPNNLFRLGLNNMSVGFSSSVFVFSDVDYEETGIMTEYIHDPNPMRIEAPLVYIYNTHQLENFSMENLAPYNIKPNVLMASYILREHLNSLGIPTIVETADITEILRINNWAYRFSYQASRMLIKDAMEKNPTIEYLIDLHRDAVPHNISTAEINGINHARIMFVVGREHANYKENLRIATALNDLIVADNPTLSRGIMIKEGPGVNGIYNQDLSGNAILIELGGQFNTIEEVNNTMPILARVLFKHIRGEAL